MRRRLLATYLSMLVVIIAALALPLGAVIAARSTEVVFLDRHSDAIRFASFADQALNDGRTESLNAQLTRYDDLFDVVAAVYNRDGDLVVASRPDPDLGAPEVTTAMRSALAGEGSDVDIVWPWQTRPMVVAVPVANGGDVVGAVVTISPVEGVRADTLIGWLRVAGFAVFAVLAAIYFLHRLTAWMLRPVLSLDETTHSIAAGHLAARVPGWVGPAELRRLAASFNAMIDTIETMLERRRAFVSYASHQLRNPLAALRLRVENLSPHLDRAGDEDHTLAIDEVDRLTRVCDGLLAVARAESGQPPTRTRIDAAAIADTRVAAWQPVARRARIRLVRSGARVASAYASDGTLDQVLDVLLDNAIKFAGPGATVNVRVDEPDPDSKSVFLEVIDDGPGLPAKALDAAVRPYWRASAHGERPGSGLGLAIVAMLVETGGGELTLGSTTPHGLTARVRLPATSASMASSGGSTPPPPGVAASEMSPQPPAGPDAAPPNAPQPALTWRRRGAG
jgi:signal transduction histidine kinase